MRCLSSCSYIKPQRVLPYRARQPRCLSSCSYIKPQRWNGTKPTNTVVYHLVPTSNHNRGILPWQPLHVVYHLVPTSNHNTTSSLVEHVPLFIILFLHQTTTSCLIILSIPMLFIILFLHQTTTRNIFGQFSTGCLSSCSYIKPQLDTLHILLDPVVYHLVPTSNHNG